MKKKRFWPSITIFCSFWWSFHSDDHQLETVWTNNQGIPSVLQHISLVVCQIFFIWIDLSSVALSLFPLLCLVAFHADTGSSKLTELWCKTWGTWRKMYLLSWKLGQTPIWAFQTQVTCRSHASPSDLCLISMLSRWELKKCDAVQLFFFCCSHCWENIRSVSHVREKVTTGTLSAAAWMKLKQANLWTGECYIFPLSKVRASQRLRGRCLSTLMVNPAHSIWPLLPNFPSVSVCTYTSLKQFTVREIRIAVSPSLLLKKAVRVLTVSLIGPVWNLSTSLPLSHLSGWGRLRFPYCAAVKIVLSPQCVHETQECQWQTGHRERLQLGWIESLWRGGGGGKRPETGTAHTQPRRHPLTPRHLEDSATIEAPLHLILSKGWFFTAWP